VTLDQPDQDVGSQWQWLAGSGGPTCPFQGRFDVHLGRDPRPADEVDTMCLSRVGMGTQHLPICPRRPPPAWGAADRVPTREPQINPSAWPSPTASARDCTPNFR
jgi:hypothetical protein